MRPSAKAHWIATAGSVAKLVGAAIGTTVVIGGVIAGGFAAYYGLETSDHATKAHQTLDIKIELRETKEHAQEQHNAINVRLDNIQSAQSKTLGRIEQTLEKLDARTWHINDRLKNR